LPVRAVECAPEKYGRTAEVFTNENLRLIYGGKLSLLTEVAEKRQLYVIDMTCRRGKY